MTDHPTTPDAGLPEGVDDAVRAELTSLRESIDNIDAAVVHMLAERFKATQRVGRLKAEHKLPRRIRPASAPRSSACASWPPVRTWTRCSRRSSSRSSSPRSSATTRPSRATP